MKVAIIYASTTGNTQAMAEAIAAGAQAKGAEVVVSEADSFDTATLGDYDSIAFGSPAMGAEELEDSVEVFSHLLKVTLVARQFPSLVHTTGVTVSG